MQNKYIKVITMILAILMVVMNVSTSISAVDFQNECFVNIGEDVRNEHIVNTSNNVREIRETSCVQTEKSVIEIESLREENVKHFKLADGSCQAIIYSQAVHRRDSNGIWQDIDNNLYLNELNDEEVYVTADKRVSFAKEYCPNSKLFSINENGYSISMSLEENESQIKQSTSGSGEKSIGSKPSVTNAKASRENSWKTVEEAARISNTTSLKYSDVAENTDIQYVLEGNSVKENIVVNAKSDNYIYKFRMNTEGLIAECDREGKIVFYDENDGTVRYLIPIPYMYDADGVTSYNVKYELDKQSDDTYLISIVADEQWINSSERVFPVTIDPTVVGDDIAIDTYISSLSKDTNYGSEDNIWISGTKTAFIKIGLPNSIYLPQGAVITNASLNVYYYYLSNVTSGELVAGAYEILYPWSSDQVTWNIANQNPNLGISSTVVSTATLSVDSSNGVNSPGLAVFDITDLMQDWIDGQSNYGVALKYISGTNYSVILKSSEATGSFGPYYSITYYPVIDIEPSRITMNVGGTQQIPYTTYPSGSSVVWSSSKTSVVTVNSNGVITAVSDGTARVTAACYDSRTDCTFVDTVYVYVYPSTGVQDNTSYYLMNYLSFRFISVETDSDMECTGVYARWGSDSQLSQWRIKAQSNGTFRFESGYNLSEQYLGVTNDVVNVYTSNQGENLNFTIERVESGTYDGTYLIRYGNMYLTEDYTFTNTTIYLSSSKTAASYWSLMAVEKNFADIFDFEYSGFNTTAKAGLFETVLDDAGYSTAEWKNSTPANAYDCLDNLSDIFVTRGHAGPGLVSFYDSNGNHVGNLAVNSLICSNTNSRYIDSFADNALAGLRCALFLGCGSGMDITINGVTYNLLEATYQKGAHFVLGTTESVYVHNSDAFLEGFLKAIEEGECIGGCIERGLDNAGDDVWLSDGTTGYYPIIYIGDTSQILC